MPTSAFEPPGRRCSPLPQAPIKIIGAAQSDRGTEFAARYCDYNFCASYGVNEPTRFAPSVKRLIDASQKAGRDVRALILIMVISDETDAAAMAKWEYYRAGTDMEAIAWRDAQVGDDPNTDPFARPNRQKLAGHAKMRATHGVLVGSYVSVARMLDQVAEILGVRRVMLTFDDFVIGMEQFGTRIMPLMQNCNKMRQAA